MVPETEFIDDGDDRVFRYGVVCWQRRNVVQMWFDGDDRETTYKDRLEEWTDYFVPPEDYDSGFEEGFQVIEMAAGLRKKASVARPRTRKGKIAPPPPASIATLNLARKTMNLMRCVIMLGRWTAGRANLRTTKQMTHLTTLTIRH